MIAVTAPPLLAPRSTIDMEGKPMATLFDPVQIGDLQLKNRIVMASLTRTRNFNERSPGPINVKHYVQRASAGLIITEATSVTPQGVGYPDTPGLWADAQIAGWRSVTSAVHDAGGLIVPQLPAPRRRDQAGQAEDDVRDGAIVEFLSASGLIGTFPELFKNSNCYIFV